MQFCCVKSQEIHVASDDVSIARSRKRALFVASVFTVCRYIQCIYFGVSELSALHWSTDSMYIVVVTCMLIAY